MVGSQRPDPHLGQQHHSSHRHRDAPANDSPSGHLDPGSQRLSTAPSTPWPMSPSTSQEPDHRADRPVRLRQEHRAALHQPDERSDCRRRGSRGRSLTTGSTSTPERSIRSRCGAGSAWSFRSQTRFPRVIYDNVAWGARINGFKGNMDELVERCLRQAALWDEVKDKLKESGLALSGGQQQRLCIARALAINPDVILMDEPCCALDPISTLKIEDLMRELVSDVHDRHRHPQHAAGGPRLRPDRLLLAEREAAGDPGRGEPDQRALHQPARPADRGLHHRPLRIGGRHAETRLMTRADTTYAHQMQELRDVVVAMSSMVDKAIARSIDALTRPGRRTGASKYVAADRDDQPAALADRGAGAADHRHPGADGRRPAH